MPFIPWDILINIRGEVETVNKNCFEKTAVPT